MLGIILKELYSQYSYSCCFLLLFIEILCFDTRLFLILPIFYYKKSVLALAKILASYKSTLCRITSLEIIQFCFQHFSLAS